jgi:hypothetical protein
MRRFSKILALVVTGGAILQTTTASCQETLGPLVAELAVSLVLQALLGGFAT